MSNADVLANGDDDFYLPPGFRFHPTDEELITHYLSNKVLDTNFDPKAISEADLNKSEPWDLPCKAKMGEKEWYFFCVRDRKYPTGLRTNRATNEGYWKATGKDKEIFQEKSLVGMKKTLVFYKGRAPKGVKSNWVMHEYRLEGKKYRNNFPKTAKNEWVLCRIFHKKSGKKDIDSSLVRMNSFKNDLASSFLPPLMDSPYNSFRTIDVEPNHVTCFSDENNRPRLPEEAFNSSNVQNSRNPRNPSNLSQTSLLLQRLSLPFSLINNQNSSNMNNLVGGNPLIMQDQAFLRSLMEARGFSTKQNCKPETNITCPSQETRLANDHNPETYSNFANYDNGRTYGVQGGTSTSTGLVDLDCLWNYCMNE